MLRREAQTLSLLECRLTIYETVLEHVDHIAFNEIQRANDHTSNNNNKVKRAIMSFQQAAKLVNAISQRDIAENNKLIVDISELSRWNCKDQCYLLLDVFQSGTMDVMQRWFCKKYVQIKYFEASWPGALVAHRSQPCPDLCTHIREQKASLWS